MATIFTRDKRNDWTSSATREWEARGLIPHLLQELLDNRSAPVSTRENYCKWSTTGNREQPTWHGMVCLPTNENEIDSGHGLSLTQEIIGIFHPRSGWITPPLSIEFDMSTWVVFKLRERVRWCFLLDRFTPWFFYFLNWANRVNRVTEWQSGLTRKESSACWSHHCRSVLDWHSTFMIPEIPDSKIQPHVCI